MRLFTGEAMDAPELWGFCGGEVGVFTMPGPGRSGVNEDAAAVVPVTETSGVLLVADGVGGQPGGESAARLALECIAEAVRAAPRSEPSLRGAILDGFEHANQAVRELGIGAGTTIAAVELAGDSVRSYHAGDSEILVVGQRGRVKLQTVSHSPTGYGVEAGLLDEGEALHHEARHLISNAVGVSDMRVEVGSPVRLQPHDRVLLATDGLLDNAHAEEIIELIRCGPLGSACANLAKRGATRMTDPGRDEPSKPDDLTFVLFRPPRRRP